MPKRTSGRDVPAKKLLGRRNVELGSDTYIQQARSLLLASWQQIVQGLIDQAARGGYQQAKILLDLCGISKIGGNAEHGKSLSDSLLQGLEIYVDQTDAGKDGMQDNEMEHGRKQQEKR